MSGRARVAGLLAVAAVGAAAGAQAPPPPVPLRASAEAQLEWARHLRVSLRGLRGEPLERGRTAAVRAYRAVLRRFPDAPEACARAAFRAGELERVGGRPSEAARLFLRAHTCGGGTRWAARAALELGHVHRRAGRFELAEESYRAAREEGGGWPRDRDEALYWAARAIEAQGRPARARCVLERLVATGSDVTARLRAADALARSLLEEGRLDGAQRALRSAKKRLGSVLEERTERGRRARRAWSRLRAPVIVRRAHASRFANCEGRGRAHSRKNLGCGIPSADD